MSGDLKPGDVTTLGNLRPGDVGEFVSGHGSGFSFVVTEVERDLTWIRSAHDKSAWPRQHLFRDAVRYLGRGRIEPARIVMNDKPDRIAELEEQVRTLESNIRDWVDHTADGVPVPQCGALYCPKCKSAVEVTPFNAYCRECPNPDDGAWPHQPPLPLFIESCLSSPKGEPCTT